ncbi:uncharacterized protein LOC131929454 [Physella acuta]|uniref:uncharacterized protein LOC131929454 n=1 Tax=Physella acuta TaxID=109671 RepID=UPI0027DBCFC1|nr:uncharacterized protein LOC131929454 [Physella acuta]
MSGIPTGDRFLSRDLPGDLQRDLPHDVSRNLSRDLPGDPTRDGRFEIRDESEVLLDDIKCLQLTEDSFSAASHIVRENKHLIGDFKRLVDTRTQGTRQEYLKCCMEMYRLKDDSRIEEDEVLKFQVLSQFLFHLNIIPESVAEYRSADVGQVKVDVETLHKLWCWLCSFNVQCTLQLAVYDDVILSLIEYINDWDIDDDECFEYATWIIYKIIKVSDIQTQQKLCVFIEDSRSIFVKRNTVALYVLALFSNDDQIDDIIVDDDMLRNVYYDVEKVFKYRFDR